jgi:hypothetical protein
MSIEEVRAGIERETIVVFRVSNGADIANIGTLQISEMEIKGETRTMLNIITISGRIVESSLGAFVEFVSGLARAHDCYGVMLKGRRGWVKTLRPYGFRVNYMVMSRVLK